MDESDEKTRTTDDEPRMIRSPDCPWCGHPPKLWMTGSTQVFCGNEDCSCLLWDASRTPAENLTDDDRFDIGSTSDDG